MKKLSFLIIGLSLLITGKSFAQSVAGAANNGVIDSRSYASSKPVQVSKKIYRGVYKQVATDKENFSIQTSVEIYEDGKLIYSKSPTLKISGSTFPDAADTKIVSLKITSDWSKETFLR